MRHYNSDIADHVTRTIPFLAITERLNPLESEESPTSLLRLILMLVGGSIIRFLSLSILITHANLSKMRVMLLRFHRASFDTRSLKSDQWAAEIQTCRLPRP